jgi:hypothetical protein
VHLVGFTMEIWWYMSTIRSALSGQLITFNFSSIPIAFRWVLTWIALKWWRFSLPIHFGRKSQCYSRAGCLYNKYNQSIRVTDCVTVISLSASLLQKINADTFRLSQIAFNRKVLPKFENWWKFSRRFKTKSSKKKSLKTRHACISFVTKGMSKAKRPLDIRTGGCNSKLGPSENNEKYLRT